MEIFTASHSVSRLLGLFAIGLTFVTPGLADCPAALIPADDWAGKLSAALSSTSEGSGRTILIVARQRDSSSSPCRFSASEVQRALGRQISHRGWNVVALRSDLHEHVLAEISRLGLHNIDRDAFTGLQIQPPAFVADVAVSSHLERDIDWLVRTVTLETEVLEVSTSVLRYPSPAGMQESRPTTDIRLILTATPTGATFFVDSWSIKNNNALPYCLSADSTIGWWITSPQPKEGKLWYGRIMVRRVLPEDKCIEPGETFTIPSPSACISVNLGRDGREGVFTALESQFGWVQQKPPLARFMERADAADIWSDIAQCYPYGKYRALDIN